ncbi:uncharacterized protein C8A04DRAFT_32287 [Dichotomopilus funicola]|uniref:CMP/dCMP-type deaminase domain-containing protein n=1 Tax=Dichotomopilus funicola TaxID=1934379 RepID=A0AAN6UYE4_9PEZI|nr:hypothetical protein C8A04DRAFT_32287 [Dichotomopilus funicola]
MSTHHDPALFALCVRALTHIPLTDDNHTVAAAVRSRRDPSQTFVALNVYHFTGGPCAELSVLGAAAAGGLLADDIETIMAVCRRVKPGASPGVDGTAVFRVINPCGRCCQTMLDYSPRMNVVVLDREGKEVRVGVRELLVYDSVWEDGNTGREEKRLRDETA